MNPLKHLFLFFLFLLISHQSAPKIYKIDLSQPPLLRWQQFTLDYTPQLKNFISKFFANSHIPDTIWQIIGLIQKYFRDQDFVE
jgi:hypothetical protein